MTCLVVCLSTGKGTWSEVASLIRREEWSKIFLVTNRYGADNFKLDKELEKKTTIIEVDTDSDVRGLAEVVKKRLVDLSGDVALNLTSGSGKEHMALLAALLKSGVGIRLVTLLDNKIEEL